MTSGVNLEGQAADLFKLKESYTEKQIDDILEGKEIADVWSKKEKMVKKT